MLSPKLIDSGFKPALAQQIVAMKMFSHSMDLAFHRHILISQVWARGSKATTDGYCSQY
jgi:hypothetical protein